MDAAKLAGLRSLSAQPDWDHRARQAVNDAVMPLNARRLAAVAALTGAGAHPGVEVVARGGEIETWMRRESQTWGDLRSVRVSALEADLGRSLPHNRSCVDNGLRMVSVFDYGGATPAARELLAGEVKGLYLFAYAPVQMKIVDLRTVLLQGPFLDDQPTVMAVSDPATLGAAAGYWRAVMRSAVPCRRSLAPYPDLTPRQHHVMALLQEDFSDERVASVLGVSVRTVRSDIAGALRAFGVTSRFAAGVRFAAASAAGRTGHEPVPSR